jgi:hypothetical protein
MNNRPIYGPIAIGRHCSWRIARFAAATLLLLGFFAASAAAQSLPKEFVGKFRGLIISSTGEDEGEFDFVSSASRSGFTLSWTPGNSVVFEATDKKNVFHDRKSGRLLEGAPAFWARLEGSKLIVYATRLDEHGGYDIYTYIYEPTAGGLALAIRHLRSGSEPLESKGRLERYDG